MNATEIPQSLKEVLYRTHFGVLSTFSIKFPEYPFGSVVPYCLDERGVPFILVSRLAQHTQNLMDNPHVSLVILDADLQPSNNIQTEARFTLLGQFKRVSDATVVEVLAERYYRFFPASVGYHSELDFEFYRFEVTKIRSIPGFGQARWLSPSALFQPNPFSPEDEARIVDHMNSDHQDALGHYTELFCTASPNCPKSSDTAMEESGDDTAMLGIDGAGFHMRANGRIHRILFPHPVCSLAEARQALVEMARLAPISE